MPFEKLADLVQKSFHYQTPVRKLLFPFWWIFEHYEKLIRKIASFSDPFGHFFLYKTIFFLNKKQILKLWWICNAYNFQIYFLILDYCVHRAEYGCSEVVSRMFKCELCDKEVKHTRNIIGAHMKMVHLISWKEYQVSYQYTYLLGYLDIISPFLTTSLLVDIFYPERGH